MALVQIAIDEASFDDLSEKMFWADYRSPDERFRDAQYHIVARVDGLKIIIWADEHPPPHFHVSYQGQDASFSIVDCSRLAGSEGLERYEWVILKWWVENREKLISKWNSTRPIDCAVGPI